MKQDISTAIWVESKDPTRAIEKYYEKEM